MSIPEHARTDTARPRTARQWFAIALLGAIALVIGIIIAAGIGRLTEGNAQSIVILIGGLLEFGGLITLLTGLTRGALTVVRG